MCLTVCACVRYGQCVLLALIVFFCVWSVSMTDVAAIARELVEIIVKLQFIAAKLQKAAKNQDKPG